MRIKFDISRKYRRAHGEGRFIGVRIPHDLCWKFVDLRISVMQNMQIVVVFYRKNILNKTLPRKI